MSGKLCLVTGATRGLGLATAIGLARQGARVVVIGRDALRIKNALAAVRQMAGSALVDGLQADLSSQADVRRVAQEFLACYARLDVLVNNVGATLLQYQASPDGVEMSWALNYLNHFLLTNLLLERIKDTAAQAGEARILEITSSIYRLAPARFDRLQKRQGYNGVLAYAHSKRAQIVFTLQLAQQLQHSRVAVNAITPGFVATNVASDNRGLAGLAMAVIRRFSLPVIEGVKPIVHLASSPALHGMTGGYYARYQSQRAAPDCRSAEVVEQLWRISGEMVDIN
jgi:NAD(P)-dependent dehydrogenase (short-subunit alcohol dehydrogenase family)